MAKYFAPLLVLLFLCSVLLFGFALVAKMMVKKTVSIRTNLQKKLR